METNNENGAMVCAGCGSGSLYMRTESRDKIKYWCFACLRQQMTLRRKAKAAGEYLDPCTITPVNVFSLRSERIKSYKHVCKVCYNAEGTVTFADEGGQVFYVCQSCAEKLRTECNKTFKKKF